MTTLDANQYDNDIDRIRSTVATLRNIIKQVELAREWVYIIKTNNIIYLYIPYF